jgi:glycosyltransferase involved in cell wall biosynthesis
MISGLIFSIIVPTYNRPERLQACLQSIAQLDYPRDRFEVVVVDDGSSTPLDETVAPFQPQLALTLIRQLNAGPASARNTGATHATGQFLVFTDDDCVMVPNYLSVLEHHVHRSPDRLIGGQTLNALPDNLCSAASQLLIDYLYSYYNETSEACFFASNNFAMPAAQFHTLGGFSTSFPLAAGEDREFCDRWLHQGYKMLYAPTVQIRHAHHLTLQKFWRQHFNYGRGAFCFHQVRAQRSRANIQVEPISFYFNLLRYPFTTTAPHRAIGLGWLLILSQIANVAGFFWERVNHPKNPPELGIV